MDLDACKKECSIFIQQKENETNWMKINNLFENLTKVMNSKEIIGKNFSYFNELTIRTVQSDRSKLNGTCLAFLENCVKIHNLYDFNHFVPILLKLSGRANKVFVIRAQSALIELCRVNEVRKLPKLLSEAIISNNKKIRESAFMVIALRCTEKYDIFRKFIDIGKKDASVEVRTICKKIVEPFSENLIENSSSKNDILLKCTPRKHIKPNPIIQDKLKNETLGNNDLFKLKNLAFSNKKMQFSQIKTPNLDNYLNEAKKDENLLKQKLLEHKKDILKNKEIFKGSANIENNIVEEDKFIKGRFADPKSISLNRPPVQKKTFLDKRICTEQQKMEIKNEFNNEIKDVLNHEKNNNCKQNEILFIEENLVKEERKITYEDEVFMFNSDMRSSKDFSITHEIIDSKSANMEVEKSDNNLIFEEKSINDQINSTSQTLASDMDLINKSFANITIDEGSRIYEKAIEIENDKKIEEFIKKEIELQTSPNVLGANSNSTNIVESCTIENVFVENQNNYTESNFVEGLSIENNFVERVCIENPDNTIILNTPIKQKKLEIPDCDKTTIINTPFKTKHKIFNEELFSKSNKLEKEKPKFKNIEPVKKLNGNLEISNPGNLTEVSSDMNIEE